MYTTVANFAIYENTNEFAGMAELGLPSLKFLTQTITGAGIAGEIEAVLIGMISAMEVSFKFLTLNANTVSMSTPKMHTWECREAQEYTDGDNGKVGFTGLKHVFKGMPKQMDGGTLKPQSTSDAAVTATVDYWATYIDGVKTLEIDPKHLICYMDGTDYLADYRTAIGK